MSTTTKSSTVPSPSSALEDFKLEIVKKDSGIVHSVSYVIDSEHFVLINGTPLSELLPQKEEGEIPEPKKKKGRVEPNIGDDYFYLNETNDIIKTQWNLSVHDYFRFKARNVFPTLEKVQFHQKTNSILNKIYNFIEDEELKVVSELSMEGWGIQYNLETKEWELRFDMYCHHTFVVNTISYLPRFENRNDAQLILDKFRDDLNHFLLDY